MGSRRQHLLLQNLHHFIKIMGDKVNRIKGRVNAPMQKLKFKMIYCSDWQRNLGRIMVTKFSNTSHYSVFKSYFSLILHSEKG